MRLNHIFLSELLCLLLVNWNGLGAAEFLVKPSTAPNAQPIREAIRRASPGDRITLAAGIYPEHIIINKSLILRGETGAVMTGSKKFEAKWNEDPKLTGVFRTPLKSRPRGLLVNGEFIAELTFDRVQEGGAWHWKTLLSQGPPLSGFNQIQALWMYHPQSQMLYARFIGQKNPQDLKLSIIIESDALIHLYGAKDVLIENLTFEQSTRAVLIDNQSQRCIIRQCKVSSFEVTGITLSGGSSHCRIEHCDITRGSLEEWSPTLGHDKANYEIWKIHKEAGKYDRNAINLLRAGADNQIINNHLHRVFDGVSLGDFRRESLDTPLTHPNEGRNTLIAHNLIEHTRDSGIELGVGCINVNVHHNLLRNTHGGLRFKLPRIGPLYIHHNRLINGSPFNLWFSMDASPAEAYVYHNTVVGGRDFLIVSQESMRRQTVTPKWHFLNNLSLANTGFCRTGKKREQDFIAAYNMSSGTSRPWPLGSTQDRNNFYQVKVSHNTAGVPSKGSPTIDAGLDLSTYLDGKALPGCPAGYFRGKAPDIGVDEVQ